MSKFTLTDAFVSVNGTNLSNHFSSITIEQTADEIEFTSFGAGYREFGAGLKDATISGDVFQDYGGTADVDLILYPLFASGGTFDVVVRPTSASAGSANPSYTMRSRLFGFNPIAGAVGDASATSVTFRNAGTAGIVRGTA